MTVLLSHANSMIPRTETGNEPSLVNDLVYADDTLVVAIEGYRANEIMRCIMHVSTECGLSLTKGEGSTCAMRCGHSLSCQSA